jgi:hypothetical protein
MWGGQRQAADMSRSGLFIDLINPINFIQPSLIRADAQKVFLMRLIGLYRECVCYLGAVRCFVGLM